MTEGASEGLAFACLGEIKKKFIQNYDYDKIASFYAYQLEEFVPTLKQLMVSYKTNYYL
jgi:DNA-binding MarR family transcriptional regulator